VDNGHIERVVRQAQEFDRLAQRLFFVSDIFLLLCGK
jgi:hypothetical protein